MIDLRTKALPNTVTVGGRAYSINTDFRIWLRFEQDLAAGNMPVKIGYLFKNEIPKNCTFDELFVFARPKDVLPKLEPGGDIILDFEYDADYILAAFWGQYNINLLEADMHWHVFLALLKGLNESTRLREIMGYRSYTKQNNNVDQFEKLKAAWAIERMTIEEKEAIETFSNKFK